ncbi:MAG: fasciclin domain-containing protein [Vicinamibacteraceae bacterium]|nr:fasciclin domain-containing protein [Vicinamibacteraceae bacterium]
MKKLMNVIGVGLVAANVTACSSTNSPVAPSRVATAQAGDASDSVSTSTRPDFATGAKPGNETIVQIVLREDGEFDVLQAAIIRAGLVDALNGQRQLTVFAPTDQAFVTTLGVADEAAAIAAVNGLPIPDLTNILLYHVIEGRRNSRSVLAAPQYTTLGGATLTRAELVAAGIAATDISASNGIVHVINRVLLPAR